MSRKIQVTVDDSTGDMIRSCAASMGLSVSSFARMALINALPEKDTPLIQQALKDVKNGDVEHISLEDLKNQIDKL